MQKRGCHVIIPSVCPVEICPQQRGSISCFITNLVPTTAFSILDNSMYSVFAFFNTFPWEHDSRFTSVFEIGFVEIVEMFWNFTSEKNNFGLFHIFCIISRCINNLNAQCTKLWDLIKANNFCSCHAPNLLHFVGIQIFFNLLHKLFTQIQIKYIKR